jgi:5-methylcytosine-specific restriction endonuclease McrA
LARGKRQRILAIFAWATDSTFERGELPGTGEAVWSGKCLHCNARLVIAADGELLSRATIEHIVPRARGGTDELENLALACAGCNAEKGIRHDSDRAGGARAREVVALLLERRRRRWRDPRP